MSATTLQRQLAASVIALILTLIGAAVNSNVIAGLGVIGLIIMFVVLMDGED